MRKHSSKEQLRKGEMGAIFFALQERTFHKFLSYIHTVKVEANEARKFGGEFQ